jgi:hypothetical protein
MRTYQIDYQLRGEWIPGFVVNMEPRHLKFYIEFLNGERPLVAVNSHKKKIDRNQKRCLPTRIRSVEPDWNQEDGYYEFDGMSVKYVDLTETRR